jgi:hypothetical protein
LLGFLTLGAQRIQLGIWKRITQPSEIGRQIFCRLFGELDEKRVINYYPETYEEFGKVMMEFV